MQTEVIISIIVVVILTFFAYSAWSFKADLYENYLEGMWKGDDDFCEDSGLTSMLLYIGEAKPSDRGTSRDGYLVMNRDVSNQSLVLTYAKQNGGFYSTSPYKIKMNVEYDIDAVMPTELTFVFDILSGQLKIYSEEDSKLYGVFYKDHEISSL